MRQGLRSNGLSIALFGAFLIFQIGFSIVGQRQYNQEQAEHHLPMIGYLDYVSSGAFMEAMMENWESEFLQMFAYILMTKYLFQRGSAESKPLDPPEPDDPVTFSDRVPWPVRKGGIILKLYENSLSLALLLLFLLSFVLHAVGGADEYSAQAVAHGGHAVTALEYLGTSQFWFESLQNWQSEFFSIGVLVVLTIWLRQKGSPQSKPVDSPHDATGAG